MTMPEGAKPSVYESIFILEKNGEKKEFTLDNYPDSTWTFVDTRTILKEKGYEFFMDSNTNQQFIIVEDTKLQEIRQKYGVTYQERYDETHSVIRLCTSWATKEENVKAFLQDM